VLFGHAAFSFHHGGVLPLPSLSLPISHLFTLYFPLAFTGFDCVAVLVSAPFQNEVVHNSPTAPAANEIRVKIEYKKRVVSDAPMASCFIFFVCFRHGKAKPHIHWQKQNMI
jgi:hypothetical protein